MFITVLLSWLALGVSYGAYHFVIAPRLFPKLRNLPGPDSPKGLLGLGGNLNDILSSHRSRYANEEFVGKYGRSYKITGLGHWDERLITTDPVALAHILNHTNDYQKPVPTRKLLTKLLGEGMLAAEGYIHKRMRRVGAPAFGVQHLRALVPIVFGKAQELKVKWAELIAANTSEGDWPLGVRADDKKLKDGQGRLDICRWFSRATFDVIGLAGFTYNFASIQEQSNELFLAYKDMFEVAVSQGDDGLWLLLILYFPFVEWLFPDEKTRVVRKSHKIIYTVGRALVQERKQQILESEKSGSQLDKSDFLTLLLKSNLSTEIPVEQRISDDDILHNINTFFFAGSDTSSLSLTWTIQLLAMRPEIQRKLREELLTLPLPDPSLLASADQDFWQDFWQQVDALPYLNKVVREGFRLIPPVHSSIRVAMKDEVIPTADVVRMRDGTERKGIEIKKGTYIHIPMQSINTDRSTWGPDAWDFNPDRWDNLPEAVKGNPGIVNNVLTFSAGPRACVGYRFSIIEIKAFIYVLVSSFEFNPAEKIRLTNAVLTRPYLAHAKKGTASQLPLIVSPYQPSGH